MSLYFDAGSEEMGTEEGVPGHGITYYVAYLDKTQENIHPASIENKPSA
jgi:hypothetical protein